MHMPEPLFSDCFRLGIQSNSHKEMKNDYKNTQNDYNERKNDQKEAQNDYKDANLHKGT